MLVSVVFFFFQAEDGIRDATVTEVQTCALPICPVLPEQRRSGEKIGGITVVGFQTLQMGRPGRSEERRVGKEWAARRGRGEGERKEKRWGVEEAGKEKASHTG